MVLTPQATKTPSGAVDVYKQDLSVSATLGQLRVVVLLLFVSRVQHYLKLFDVGGQALSEAKESTRKTAEDAVSTVSTSRPPPFTC